MASLVKLALLSFKTSAKMWIIFYFFVWYMCCDVLIQKSGSQMAVFVYKSIIFLLYKAKVILKLSSSAKCSQARTFIHQKFSKKGENLIMIYAWAMMSSWRKMVVKMAVLILENIISQGIDLNWVTLTLVLGQFEIRKTLFA